MPRNGHSIIGNRRRQPCRTILLVLIHGVTLASSGCLYTGSVSDYIHNGFKVGPDFVPPGAEVETHWIDEGDARLLGEMPRYNHWWEVFDDPVMSELIATTQAQNLTLQEAGIRVLESRAELGIAIGSIFPQEQKFSGDLRHTQISKSTIESRPLIAAEVPRSFNRWSTGFDAA